MQSGNDAGKNILHTGRGDGEMCKTCHETLGYIVHHKTELKPYNIDAPDIALNFSNLKYVCLECQ